MLHGVNLLLAASQSLDASAQAVDGTQALAAIIPILLGVAAMFWLLFFANWGQSAGREP